MTHHQPPTDAGLRFFLDTRMRDAVNDPEIIRECLTLALVARDKGDSPERAMTVILSNFVHRALGLDIKL